MTSGKRPKRRRGEISVSYASDSNKEDSASDDQEYHRKSKGKEKLQEGVGQDAQEEEEKVGAGSLQKDNVVEQVCGICLTEEDVERGKLDCCDHYFCFGCIMEWAKVESRCPTCKQRFVTIVRPPLPGVPRSRPRTFRIPHRNQVYEPSEEEILQFTDPYQHTVCSECQEAGDERLLLLCDGCDAAAHTYCVGLGRSVPRGDWFCNHCSSMHVHGFSSDDQEHEEENESENSSPLLTLVITQVQPLPRRRPPRRAAAPRLNRAGGRRTRLHPVPTLSQEAQTLILSTPEGSRSGAFGGELESSPAAARTLSQQRIIHQRVNDLRNHWNQLRRGELEFMSTSLSALPRTRAAHAEQNQLSQNSRSAVPVDARSDDISQAWSMMERARALRGDRAVPAPAPETRPDTRVSGQRDSSHAGIPNWSEGAAIHASRVNQSREQNSRPDNPRESTQMREQNPRQDNTRDSNCLVEGTSRGRRGSRSGGKGDGDPDHDAPASNMGELRISRDGNEGIARVPSIAPRILRERERGRVAERSERRTDAEEEQGSRLQERGRIAERGERRTHADKEQHSRSQERGRSGERSEKTHADKEQGSRELERGRFAERSERRARADEEQGSREQERGRIVERSERTHAEEEQGSGEQERGHIAERSERTHADEEQGSREQERGPIAETSERRTHTEEEQGSRPSVSGAAREEKDTKGQVLNLVKAELKPLFQLGHIDKKQHKKIAWSATQSLLAAFGLEHRGPETRAFGSLSSACTHVSSSSTSTFLPSCCSHCLQHHVHKVVASLVKRSVGNHGM